MKNVEKLSIGISNFLDFLRECESLLRIANSQQEDSLNETQDIMHAVELYDLKYHDFAKLAKMLRVVRQERREAKDLATQLQPIVDWIDKNEKIIKTLEQLLGEVRKLEKNTQNRFYNPRTNILSDKK